MPMVFCRGCGKEIHDSAPVCPHCGAPQTTAAPSSSTQPQSLKSQTVAGLLCAFLGGFGGHKFYLGRIVPGVLYLIFFWTSIPGFIAIFDLFGIAFASQEKWANKYNNGTITPPVNIVVKIIVIIIPVVSVIGILAAIALPAYQDYTMKAKMASVIVGLNAPKVIMAEYVSTKKGALLDQPTLQSIKSSVAATSAITSIDAFSYKTYADIVANVSIGKDSGSVFFVSNNLGVSWTCSFSGLPSKLAPKDCEEGSGVSRPPIEKQKIGLWDIDFANDTLAGCIRSAVEKGNANADASCKCVISKVSQQIPQNQMGEHLSEDQQAIAQAAWQSCAQ